MDNDTEALLNNEDYQSTMLEVIDHEVDLSPRTFVDWEQSTNMMIVNTNGLDLNSVVDIDTYRQEVANRGVHGVDINYRTKWLEENGYEVTRENMIKVSLPAVGVVE